VKRGFCGEKREMMMMRGEGRRKQRQEETKWRDIEVDWKRRMQGGN
jgi:hypothetical protein